MMSKYLAYPILLLTCILGLVCNVSCSKDDEPVKSPEDIIGIWTPDNTNYFKFGDDNTARHLEIMYQDNESIGVWTTDVYFYEPGYDLVVYLTSDHEADVYQLVSIDANHFTWCWVYEIEATSFSSVSQIIGEILNKAQEGFHLDPALYQTFAKVSESEFLDILSSLSLELPW